MSRICPEYFDPDRADRSPAAEVLVREDPGEEEEEDEKDDDKKDDEEKEDEGYSE